MSRVAAFPEQIIKPFQIGQHHLRRPDSRGIRLSDPAGDDGEFHAGASVLPVVIVR
jgi:hypothetical protein